MIYKRDFLFCLLVTFYYRMLAKALKKINYEENDEKTYFVAKPKVPKVKLLVKINYAETLELRF